MRAHFNGRVFVAFSSLVFAGSLLLAAGCRSGGGNAASSSFVLDSVGSASRRAPVRSVRLAAGGAPAATRGAIRFVPNYSRDLNNARRWDRERLTVHVAAPAADSSAPYRDYEALVRKGAHLWAPFHQRFLSVDFVSDPRDADIRVSFVPAGSLPDGAVGRTEVTYRDRDNVLVAATVRIDWTLTDETVSQVSAHEMGHAFGLEGHSGSKDDLMYARVHLPAVVTDRDANTLGWNYALDARRATAAPSAQPHVASAASPSGLSTYAAACHIGEDSHDH